MAAMANPTAESRRLLPRFSLLTTLFVIALVACGFTIWRQWRELVPLRVEVVSLRSQLGVLTIDDEDKVHVIQIPEPGFRWHWRIYLPAGHDYSLHVIRYSVDQEGFPVTTQDRSFLGKGGREINIRVGVDERQGYVYLQRDGINSPIVELAGSNVLSGKEMADMEAAGHAGQVTSSPDERLLLLKFREVPAPAKPPDGMMIWLTNKKN
jgi:hypothetical protein